MKGSDLTFDPCFKVKVYLQKGFVFSIMGSGILEFENSP